MEWQSHLKEILFEYFREGIQNQIGMSQPIYLLIKVTYFSVYTTLGGRSCLYIVEPPAALILIQNIELQSATSPSPLPGFSIY